jgi:hypothetical protein
LQARGVTGDWPNRGILRDFNRNSASVCGRLDDLDSRTDHIEKINRLHVELAARLPAHAVIPKTVNPAVVRHLPPAARHAFEDAFAAALHPVFIVAAAVSLLAFALTWLLREVPLRTSSRAGDALPPPRDEHAATEAAA